MQSGYFLSYARRNGARVGFFAAAMITPHYDSAPDAAPPRTSGPGFTADGHPDIPPATTVDVERRKIQSQSRCAMRSRLPLFVALFAFAASGAAVAENSPSSGGGGGGGASAGSGGGGGHAGGGGGGSGAHGGGGCGSGLSGGGGAG